MHEDDDAKQAGRANSSAGSTSGPSTGSAPGSTAGSTAGDAFGHARSEQSLASAEAAGSFENNGERPLRRSFRFSFGIDRLGLLALRAPVLAAVIVALLSVIAAFGVVRLDPDDSLTELFRTNTAEFKQYEQVSTRFPSSEYDVLVVVEGADLLQRAQIEAFRSMVVDLNLVEGVDGLVSMFSARGQPDPSGYVPPIWPDALPVGEAYDATVALARENEIIRGKFLSDDGTLALVVLAIDQTKIPALGLDAVIGEIDQTARFGLEGSGLTARLTGAPVMQLEIRNAVQRDQLLYNGLGFLLGALVALIFFRRFSLMLIVIAGPATAVLWSLGIIGFLDFRLNLFINVITPLITVSGFSDSMHLVFSIRRDILAGKDRLIAARNAVLDVAPACLLTAMNAALALVSFAFAESALIRTFGEAALIAIATSYIAVAVVVPTLAVLLIRREPPRARDADRNFKDDTGVNAVTHMSEWIVRHVVRRPALISALAVAVVALSGIAYLQLEPRYRLADQVPDREQALDATGSLDAKLTGANPMHVMIEWKHDRPLYSPEVMGLIARVHGVVEERAGLGNVWSLESLRRWLRDAGDERLETVERYVGLLPEHLVRRFIEAGDRAVLVTGRLPDIDASQILPVVETLDRALDQVRKEAPEFEISVTGLPVIAARNSARLIGELNVGLVGDMFVIFIFLGLALRSVLSGAASVLPSMFPIFATGALLYASGEGLQFASIVAITVAFALAIDSTIHFLNRFNLEEERIGSGPGAHIPALIATIHHIGPAIVLTTIVLALGLGVTMLSDLPSLRLFGRLTAVTLIAALLGQLVILPATIALGRTWFPRPADGR